ncbi:ABC transporter permease subunit [Haloferula sp.]|uniref:ABC transporter permease subunit n=1 Tax=Haloferula sp. TaxID=2497595 RepID=UPI00329C365A
MNFPRKLGLLMVLVAVAAAVAEWTVWSLPSLRWFFSFDATPDQVLDAEAGKVLGIPVDWLTFRENQGAIVGYGWCILLLLSGVGLMIRTKGFQWNPLTLRKIERFRSIGRGHTSLKLIGVLVFLALLDQVLVGKRALAVRHEGVWSFPAFKDRIFSDEEFGGESEEEADYRELKKEWKEASPDSLVILPPVPWDPSFDSDELLREKLVQIKGLIQDPSGKNPYNGYAVCFENTESEKKVLSGRIREGKLSGPVQTYNESGELAGKEEWKDGERVSEQVIGAVDPSAGKWYKVIYMPLPPDLETRHFLGTDSKGWDLLAQLYGGLQVLFKAAVLYLLLTYLIGITLGALMGYFGGAFDLFMQRVMEILSNIPFLLVVMIIIANIGRDKVTLATILIIICIFSWISVAMYLRTATYKEKARDYVSAARVTGVSTPRVIFRHILPNVIATLVTLVPFSVTSVVTSLTALDFLGYGLSDSYPSWGRLLSDGVSHLGSPWIVSSVFVMLVLLLLLVTFVGEAIREAFDPRTFTTYQ